jgi:multimeric flavodoxin WrbA
MEIRLMKRIAVNGSPRKQWNTAQLLEKAVEGAKTAGMDAKLVHIYDYEFKGCISCFACKLVGGASRGRCALRDSLTSLLDEIRDVDALVLGSPLYLMTETGEMRSFMERVCFPYFCYSNPPSTMFPRRIKTAFIYTMNIGEEMAANMGLPDHLKMTKFFMELVFGPCEMQICYDTLQYNDYEAHGNVMFDGAAKKRRNVEMFPKDLEQAFELGRRMAQPLTVG